MRYFDFNMFNTTIQKFSNNEIQKILNIHCDYKDKTLIKTLLATSTDFKFHSKEENRYIFMNEIEEQKKFIIIEWD